MFGYIKKIVFSFVFELPILTFYTSMLHNMYA